MTMDSSRTMNGSFGSVYDANGKWLTNAKSFEATVEIQKEEMYVAGSRWARTKVKGLKGSGNLQGYRLTTEMIEAIGAVADDSKGAYVTELRAKLNDPEAYGAYDIRLKNVSFDRIPLMKYELNSIVEEDLPFTFTQYELLNKITV